LKHFVACKKQKQVFKTSGAAIEAAIQNAGIKKGAIFVWRLF
jgi:hypothetical protein